MARKSKVVPVEAVETVVESAVESAVEVQPKVVKNQGVGKMVRELIADGLNNTEILKLVHAEYGNTQTTYACVAWYRNKMKKNNQLATTKKAVEVVKKFMNDEVEVDLDAEELETESESELRQMVGL